MTPQEAMIRFHLLDLAGKLYFATIIGLIWFAVHEAILYFREKKWLEEASRKSIFDEDTV